jgi:hypothetical protein
MAKMMSDIRASKPKAEMTEEHKALRGDVENDKPLWADHYSPAEYKEKRWFERRGSEQETYSAFVHGGDLNELEI